MEDDHLVVEISVEAFIDQIQWQSQLLTVFKEIFVDFPLMFSKGHISRRPIKIFRYVFLVPLRNLELNN